MSQAVQNKMPLQPGSPIVVKRLSPSEKEYITKILPDFKEGQALPANWNELVSTAQAAALAAATDPRQIPLPVDPATPPKRLETVPLESLSPEQQQVYAKQFAELSEVLQQVAANAQTAYSQQKAANQMTAHLQNPSVAAAVQHAAGPSVDVLVEEEAPEKPTPQQPQPAPASTVAKKPWQVPTDADRDQYALSAATGQPFTKTVKLLGGRLVARFRTLKREEANLLNEYVRNNRQTKLQADLNNELLAFTSMFQLVSLEYPPGLGLPAYQAPANLAEWETHGQGLVGYQEWFREHVVGNNSFWRAINTASDRFSEFVDVIEEEASSPDFT
jgi:hypothetical protein